MDKQGKNNRILDMYLRLCKGRVINKAEEAKRFGVDERSIQRDIDDIRAFLDEKTVQEAIENRNILYDRSKKGFVMSKLEDVLMSNSEILAVSKILLASRAFPKKEIVSLLGKMLAGCVPQANMKLVADLIANEKFYYVEPKHKANLKDKLWTLGEEIKQYNVLEINYQKQIASHDFVKHTVEPVAIIFSEFYFYLLAYIVEKDGKGEYVWKYDYPAIFRVDRIRKYTKIGDKFKIPYSSKFEEGRFRERIQFMFAGKLLKIQFRFTGNSIEAILDRLPTAQIVKQDAKGTIFEAEVYGQGILMWLLSQGTMVEVLKPKEVRDEMKTRITEMLELYK